MINEKVIDSHLHIEGFENEESDFVNCFEQYREGNGLASLNICVVPTKQRNVCNNMMAALYKLAHPNTYAHGGIDHIHWPITTDMPEGMDHVTQYRELMEMGFDGIKMLEAKPSHHKRNGLDLCTPALEAVFTEIEKDGTHLVLHSNDPKEFWDRSKVSEDHIARGWFYGDGTYATHEEIYRQTNEVLARHPKMKVTLAHFYFCGEHPETLVELFEKYPNLCVDITPGGEMYWAFEANPVYYREFFEKYSNRILIGTDATYPWPTDSYDWLIDRTYRFLATSDTMKAFEDRPLTGINLPKEARENILWRNFERRVGEAPRPIDKAALKRYIEKYKGLLSEEEWKYIEPHYLAL